MTSLTVAAKMKSRGTTFALIEYAIAEKRKITLENVYPGAIYTHKLLKARHNPAYNSDFPKVNNPSLLEQFVNVDDVYLKRAPETSLEGMARELIKLSEHMERAEIKACPPTNDRAYVERSDFTITDLYNDISVKIEWSILRYIALLQTFKFDALSLYETVLDWSYYREQRKKFRSCRHKYCLNMFAIEGCNIRNERPKRLDSRYCCDSCRKADYDSKKRFKENGSYLPVEYYAPIYDESEGDRYRRNEVVKPFDKIEKQISKGKAQSPVAIKSPSYKHGKVVSYNSLEEAKKVEENIGKVSIINVYRQIIRRTNT